MVSVGLPYVGDAVTGSFNLAPSRDIPAQFWALILKLYICPSRSSVASYLHVLPSIVAISTKSMLLPGAISIM